jgi:serine/threonine protein kinase
MTSSTPATVGSTQLLTEEDADQFIYIQGSPVSPLSPSETEGENEPHIVYVENEMFLLPRNYEIESLVKRTNSGNLICSAYNTDKSDRVAIHKKKPSTNLQQQKSMLRDMKIMMHLNNNPHPNVIQLRDVIEPINFQSFRDMYYVTDLMNENLGDIIKRQREQTSHMTEKMVASVIKQILLGLKHINDHGLIHRNITPNTVLINLGVDKCEVKITQFGQCRTRDVDTERYDEGPSCYNAPEEIFPKKGEKGSVRSDLWSVGCIMAELLGSEVLFKGENLQDQLERIVKLVGTPEKKDMRFLNEEGQEIIIRMKPVSAKKLEGNVPGASPAAVDLLFKMLQFNKDKRISINDAIEHSFFAILGKSHKKSKKQQVKFTPFDISYESELVDSAAVKKQCFKFIEDFTRDKRLRKEWQKRSSLRKKGSILLNSMKKRMMFKFNPPPVQKPVELPSTIEEISISDNTVAEANTSFQRKTPRKRMLARNIQNAWTKVKPYICCCC